MLPFGSITSLIPLTVLAIAYALFIGASALNRINPFAGNSSEKIVIVKATGPDHSEEPAVHYPYLQDFINSDNSNSAISAEWVCYRLTEIPPEKIYIGFYNFLFSRPPPSLFS